MNISSTIIDQFGVIRFGIDKLQGIEAREFQEHLVILLEKNIKSIIVDLSGVKFVSSWGIGMLMHGLATTKNRGGEFMVASLSDSVASTFKKLKIYTVLDVYPSTEAAMI